MGFENITKSNSLFGEGEDTSKKNIPGSRGDREEAKCCGCVHQDA